MLDCCGRLAELKALLTRLTNEWQLIEGKKSQLEKDVKSKSDQLVGLVKDIYFQEVAVSHKKNMALRKLDETRKLLVDLKSQNDEKLKQFESENPVPRYVNSSGLNIVYNSNRRTRFHHKTLDVLRHEA
ncbi:hypothetical protein HDE_09252 [Halotydeus destructor]|nr:hypothetical protein HDE_09252 [Halotydeus destructor]